MIFIKKLFKSENRGEELLHNNSALNDIEILNKIGNAILSTLSLPDIVKTTYDNLNIIIDASYFVIGIYNKANKVMDFWGIGESGVSSQFGSDDTLTDDKWFSACFLNNEEYFVNDYTPEKYNYRHFSDTIFLDSSRRKSFIYIPLMGKIAPIGFVSIQSDKASAYSKFDFEILKNIANSVSIAVQNAEAFKKIENQKNEIQIKNKSLEQIKDSLEHKVAERTAELEKINKEMKFLSIVATQTDNAVMIMDADGNILWINDCFTRIYEYDYDSFIKVRGNNIRQTSFNPDISDSIEKCIREKVPVYYDAPNVKLNGETIWTQTTLTPVLDGNGNIKNLVTIDSDITDIKVAEAKTIRTNRDLTDSIR